MSEIKLEIITPEKVIFEDTVDSITIPGTKGGFQVLKDHAPLMSTVEIGVITVNKNSEISYFTTAGGTIEIRNNKVLILADSTELTGDIDVDRAELAKKRAEERLVKKKEIEIDVLRAEFALKRALNGLGAKEKYM